ncbi:MAG: hypothetical protein NTV49_05945 [Kiritimatiellaeota bacterium]|nr:hypothetical protein [Kiritimatiellota bacterium]
MLEELREGLRKGPWKRAKEIQRWLADRHQVQMGTTGVLCAGWFPTRGLSIK